MPTGNKLAYTEKQIRNIIFINKPLLRSITSQ